MYSDDDIRAAATVSLAFSIANMLNDDEDDDDEDEEEERRRKEEEEEEYRRRKEQESNDVRDKVRVEAQKAKPKVPAPKQKKQPPKLHRELGITNKNTIYKQRVRNSDGVMDVEIRGYHNKDKNLVICIHKSKVQGKVAKKIYILVDKKSLDQYTIVKNELNPASSHTVYGESFLLKLLSDDGYIDKDQYIPMKNHINRLKYHYEYCLKKGKFYNMDAHPNGNIKYTFVVYNADGSLPNKSSRHKTS